MANSETPGTAQTKSSETTGRKARSLLAFNKLASHYRLRQDGSFGYVGFVKSAGFPSFEAFSIKPLDVKVTNEEREKRYRERMGDEAYEKMKALEESSRRFKEESKARLKELEDESRQEAESEKARAEEARAFVDSMFEEDDRKASMPPPPPPPKPWPSNEELVNDTSGTPQPTPEEERQILKIPGTLTLEKGKPNLKAKAQIQFAKATRFMRNNKLPLALLLAAGLGYGGYRYWKKRKQRKALEQ